MLPLTRYKDIFGSKTKEEAGTRFRELADKLEGKADKTLETVENDLDDAPSD